MLEHVPRPFVRRERLTAAAQRGVGRHQRARRDLVERVDVDGLLRELDRAPELAGPDRRLAADVQCAEALRADALLPAPCPRGIGAREERQPQPLERGARQALGAVPLPVLQRALAGRGVGERQLDVDLDVGFQVELDVAGARRHARRRRPARDEERTGPRHDLPGRTLPARWPSVGPEQVGELLPRQWRRPFEHQPGDGERRLEAPLGHAVAVADHDLAEEVEAHHRPRPRRAASRVIRPPRRLRTVMVSRMSLARVDVVGEGGF